MAQNTAIAYCIMLLLCPIPNMGIVSYINRKPLLTKVRIRQYNSCPKKKDNPIQFLDQNLNKNDCTGIFDLLGCS